MIEYLHSMLQGLGSIPFTEIYITVKYSQHSIDKPQFNPYLCFGTYVQPNNHYSTFQSKMKLS